LNCRRADWRCRLNSRSAMYVCNTPLGHKKNFRCALLVNFRSATHICKNGNCTSVSGTPEVQLTSRAEFLQASFLIGPVLNPDYFLGYIFQVSQICLYLRRALLQFYFLHAFTSCELTLKIHIVPTEAQKNLKPIAVF
jgi:hypothetical protein